MGVIELEQPMQGPGGAPPSPPAPPAMALRTYMCLRLSAVGVIAILAVSLFKEYHRAHDCLQGSISAYYYTNVQSVFVGALVALGLVMIVLWGKTAWEDGAFNLAGMLAPVVAFVPTTDTNKCGITDAAGNPVTTNGQAQTVIQASRDAVFNNMLAYFVVVGTVLVILAVVGAVAQWRRWPLVTEHPVAWWLPWGLAAALYLLGFIAFLPSHREWFYAHAHQLSATTLFVFIVTAVVNIAWHKWRPDPALGETRSIPWALGYATLAALMVVGAVLILALAAHISTDFRAHRTFLLEAWLIFWLAVFWSLQTWDRWKEGAPPRTSAERDRLSTAPPAAPL